MTISEPDQHANSSVCHGLRTVVSNWANVYKLSAIFCYDRNISGFQKLYLKILNTIHYTRCVSHVDCSYAVVKAL
jgi:hypothetical protein